MPGWPPQQRTFRVVRCSCADVDAPNQTIAGIATALLQACQPTWKAYAKQVIANATTLGQELVARGYKLQTSGTDNHLVLWDLRPLGLTGSKLE